MKERREENKIYMDELCVLYIIYTIQSQWKLRCAMFRYIEDSYIAHTQTHTIARIQYMNIGTHSVDSWALYI